MYYATKGILLSILDDQTNTIWNINIHNLYVYM